MYTSRCTPGRTEVTRGIVSRVTNLTASTKRVLTWSTCLDKAPIRWRHNNSRPVRRTLTLLSLTWAEQISLLTGHWQRGHPKVLSRFNIPEVFRAGTLSRTSRGNKRQEELHQHRRSRQKRVSLLHPKATGINHSKKVKSKQPRKKISMKILQLPLRHLVFLILIGTSSQWQTSCELIQNISFRI